MLDVVNSILGYNAGRDPELLPLKFAALRRDAHSFLRGTCHRYIECLPAHPVLTTAPLAWCCGDLHMENFGTYESDEGLAFDINDFDEAALAPLTHDPLRLLTDLFVLAERLELSAAEAQDMGMHFLATYSGYLASGVTACITRDSAKGVVRDLFDDLNERTHIDMLDSRTDVVKGKRRIRCDGEKALAATTEQREQVTALLDAFAATQDDPRFFKPLDIARRISGTGSLGLERAMILVRGKGSPDDNALLDLKRAAPSVLASAVKNSQPEWCHEASRIVTLQARMQAMPVALLHALGDDKCCYVLRALQPSQDRVDLDRCKGKPRRLVRLLETMAKTLAWAHLRSSACQGAADVDALIAFAQDTKWQGQLLTLVQDCSHQVKADWQIYAQAFDDGALQT